MFTGFLCSGGLRFVSFRVLGNNRGLQAMLEK
jgi:hypothetical protein